MMGGCLFVALIILLCFGFLTIFFYNRVSYLLCSDHDHFIMISEGIHAYFLFEVKNLFVECTKQRIQTVL